MKTRISRRRFLGVTATASAGIGLHHSPPVLATPAPGAATTRIAAGDPPALLGGKPLRTAPFPAWPRFDQTEEKALQDVLHSGKWFRGSGSQVDRFEEAYAQLTGARHCIATANGTSALLASLGALEVGPGDEVILPPYTFVATLNVILIHHALPVFADIDPETFQIDARKIDAAITDRTVVLLPVHIGGGSADLDAILAVARKRKVPVVEDACQAHLAEWRGRKVGTLGDAGCFSFQASKNLNSGEGGAILTSDDALAGKCYGFHNNGRARRTACYNFSYQGGRAANFRLTEFQAALLLAQMTRIEEQSRIREGNAAYLTSLMQEIPGIVPAKGYAGCTRNAWHLYMFRYQAAAFAGLPRSRFLQALTAEGIPCSGGYSPLEREPFLEATLQSRAYRRVYPEALLRDWRERNRCPENERLCQEAVWFTQTMLLGDRSDMDQIAGAISKIQRHAPDLATKA